LARAMFERFVPATGDQYRSTGLEPQFHPSMETDLVRCASVPRGPDFLLVAYNHPRDGSRGAYYLFASWPFELSNAPGFRGSSDTESGARALLAAFRHQTLSALPADSSPSGRAPQN
jgi:hypothetical protein